MAKLKFSISGRSRILTFRHLLAILIIISTIITFSQLLSTSNSDDEQIRHHKAAVYNISDPFVITNLIDQFLDTKDYTERDALWLLLVNSWSNSFETYYRRTTNLCSSTSSFDFIGKYLYQYTKKLLLDNVELQRRLTGFGLFFDYNPKEIRSKTHQTLSNIFLSPCAYLELIVLIMKVQLVLRELNIDYFIGQNTLLGALRHHDIVPWHSIVEFNLPFESKEKFLTNIKNKFELDIQEVNDSYINDKQIGFIYKVFIKEQTWPQIEIHFYEEKNSPITLGYLSKTDIIPLHLRPFGPLLLYSISKSQAMISNQRLNTCESLTWDHQLGKEIELDHQWRLPCEQLHTVYSFVQRRNSWRRGYCEESLKTKRVPFHTLSYFRYTCQENLT